MSAENEQSQRCGGRNIQHQICSPSRKWTHTKEVDVGNFLNRWNSEDLIEFSVEVGGEGDMVQRIGR